MTARSSAIHDIKQDKDCIHLITALEEKDILEYFTEMKNENEDIINITLLNYESRDN